MNRPPVWFSVCYPPGKASVPDNLTESRLSRKWVCVCVWGRGILTVLTKVDSNAHPTRWRPSPAWDPELEKRNWAAACTQPHVFPLRTLCDQLAASPCRVYYPPQWTGPCTVSINNPSSLSCLLSDYCITARGKEMEALPLSHFLVCPKQNSGHSTQYNCPVSLLLSVFFFFLIPHHA